MLQARYPGEKFCACSSYHPTTMTPPTITNNPCSDDHSYELPLRRNLLLLLDLLDVLRFVAGVLLDRLGVVSCQDGEVQLPGQTWRREHADDDAAMECFYLGTTTATLWETRTTSGSSLAARPRYRPWRRVALAQREGGNKKRASEDDGAGGDGAAAVCAICLAALEAGGCQAQAVAELGACSHAFHAACIDAWAGSGGAGGAATCPLCRTPMLPTAWEDGRSSCHDRPGD